MIIASAATTDLLEELPEVETEVLLDSMSAESASLLPCEAGIMKLPEYLRSVRKLLAEGEVVPLSAEQTRRNRKQGRASAHAALARAQAHAKGIAP